MTNSVTKQIQFKQFCIFFFSFFFFFPSYDLNVFLRDCCNVFFRHRKCKACYKQLKNLSNVVKNRAEQVGRHGSTFKELQLLMAPLDYWHWYTLTETHTHAERNTPQSPNTKLSQKESTTGKVPWLSSVTEQFTYACVCVRSNKHTFGVKYL